MNTSRRILLATLMVASLVCPRLLLAQGGSASAPAAAASAPAPGGPGTEYSDKGADTCLGCHDEEADTTTFTTAGIFKSRHGQRGNARGPFGQHGLQCEACHGPGGRHSVKGATGAERKRSINSLKADSFMPVAQRNAPCLNCHQDHERRAWHAGGHERANLACTDCHQMHTRRDAVADKSSQPEVCYRCHKTQRADFQKASTHPVRFGRMSCSDCHNPHGSGSASMLVKPTLNQTCTSCHAEKRGPLLWEHAPVAEDCSLCHQSHGSVRTALLSKSAPLLCQQCHSASGHPSVARTGSALPGQGGAGALFVVAGSCTNCHSQVHGSNHPAGAKLMR